MTRTQKKFTCCTVIDTSICQKLLLFSLFRLPVFYFKSLRCLLRALQGQMQEGETLIYFISVDSDLTWPLLLPCPTQHFLPLLQKASVNFPMQGSVLMFTHTPSWLVSNRDLATPLERGRCEGSYWPPHRGPSGILEINFCELISRRDLPVHLAFLKMFESLFEFSSAE